MKDAVIYLCTVAFLLSSVAAKGLPMIPESSAKSKFICCCRFLPSYLVTFCKLVSYSKKAVLAKSWLIHGRKVHQTEMFIEYYIIIVSILEYRVEMICVYWVLQLSKVIV